jgi:death on curing protein
VKKKARVWRWLNEDVVAAIHEAQLSEHGGIVGVRDPGLLASALGRAQNQAAYGNPDVADLAASYGYGISRNHPFLDGNKRTGFVATELFLNLNGYALSASDADCVLTMLSVTSGELSEHDFAAWVRKHLVPEK